MGGVEGEILFSRAFSGKLSLKRALLPWHPQGLKFLKIAS
jgi:hypothetical protein